MNKQEFLRELEVHLKKQEIPDIESVMQDYQDHFFHAEAAGISESEIVQKLGTPASIASAYEAENFVKRVKSAETSFSFSKAFAILGRLTVLTPFNFVLVLILAFFFVPMFVSGWSVALTGLLVGAFCLVLGLIIGPLIAGLWGFFGAFSFAMVVICLATMGTLVMYWLTKFGVMGLIHIFNLNKDFILKNQTA